MIGRALGLLVACAALCSPGRILEAQVPASDPFPRVDISLLAGYRFEGTITFSESASDSKVEVANTPVYAFSLGYSLGPNLATELFYGYAAPAGTAVARFPGESDRSLELSIHEVQAGLMLYLAPPDSPVRPYAELLLGVSVFGDHEGIGDDTVKLTPGFSAGVKAYFSDHVGVRAEVHYTPMFLYTTGNGTLICIEDFCWDTGGRYLQQVDLRAGVTFRF